MNHLVNNIEEETGINPGWINNGGLFIANNKVRKKFNFMYLGLNILLVLPFNGVTNMRSQNYRSA